jgi:hypothetical protein
VLGLWADEVEAPGVVFDRSLFDGAEAGVMGVGFDRGRADDGTRGHVVWVDTRCFRLVTPAW